MSAPAPSVSAYLLVDRGQGVDDARHDGRLAIERRHERRNGVFVANLSQRLGSGSAERIVVQQRQNSRHHGGVVDERERVERGERQKEIA